MYNILKSVAITFVLPPTGPILLVFAGVVLGVRWPRLGRTAVILGAIALWLASTPVVVSLLIEKFGSTQPVHIDEAKRAQAIVVLAAGVRRDALEYGGDTVSRLTLERVRYGATLASQTNLPILVTGGIPRGATRSEADLMRETLVGEFKVAVRWIETASTDTRQSALNSAAMLHRAGVARIVLVTHAFDAPRARRRFEEAGIEVVSAPTQIPNPTEWTLRAVLPSANVASDSFYMGYELLALLAEQFGVRGRDSTNGWLSR